ncbi:MULTISPECIES: hypothetical protein [unclassified Rathayibacter]|uniref:hypothetical protein n=1 Tax=unclassified Rathayibacter TaxID=2609250 RepID=UPI00188DAE3F|nr:MULTISPECIES: hypothetical protein [unclassified Rathayibacter]MBF4461578.1 hypothetical protein [Rathayibacter sp. VKM Ac-2879]MBF4502989.1 hypothetical protein [Rathayibacter sp. VKM Ac-2878]
MTSSSDAETTRIPSATETSGGTGPQPAREYVWPEPVTGRQPTVGAPPASSATPLPPAPLREGDPAAFGPVEPESERIRRQGNRLAGLAIALLTTAVFAALDLVALTAIRLLVGRIDADPVAVALAAATSPLFLGPVVVFVVVLALIVLLVNRAGWWAYVLGGFPVAVLVAAAALAGGWMALGGLAVPSDRDQVLAYLRDPAVLASVAAAGILAREVTVWGGALIAGRARSVKRRNAEREAAAAS